MTDLTQQWYDYLLKQTGDGPSAPSAPTNPPSMRSSTRPPPPATRWRHGAGSAHGTWPPPSRAAKLSALRSFYRWCTRWEHRTDDPTNASKHQRSATPHLTLTREEVQLLLDESPDDIRCAVALCAFLLACGWLRRRRWTGATSTAKPTASPSVVVRATRTGASACPAGWLDELGMTRRAGNVVRPDERPYTANALTLAINRAMKAAGIENTSHGLRGRYATMALTSANLVSVASSDGHAHMSTTARYTATSDADLDVIGEAVTRGF